MFVVRRTIIWGTVARGLGSPVDTQGRRIRKAAYHVVSSRCIVDDGKNRPDVKSHRMWSSLSCPPLMCCRPCRRMYLVGVDVVMPICAKPLSLVNQYIGMLSAVLSSFRVRRPFDLVGVFHAPTRI
ncbi:hypothetical protein F442_04625 [Phytophthora nicotianae P10297]|uniref:Uncharacterized protein n=1 Tax=Phytophthora nicotianae P10297 TaxID=1317064 RepID=W2ZRN5_PHYNI|nr:hypothetical protein F442_04625 [Phytophthora nicotianae P10297]